MESLAFLDVSGHGQHNGEYGRTKEGEDWLPQQQCKEGWLEGDCSDPRSGSCMCFSFHFLFYALLHRFSFLNASRLLVGDEGNMSVTYRCLFCFLVFLGGVVMNLKSISFFFCSRRKNFHKNDWTQWPYCHVTCGRDFLLT